MPHLKHIGLTNFRVFGERTDIALAPLTILTGPNSSGKSSVLKAIQLLQENIADIGHLNFSHGEHKLGNFDMALNRNATDKTMVFTLPFEYKDMPEEMYMDWIYEMDMSNPLQYGKLTRLSVCLKKDGHEVIGITPWDKIDIDFEYFHKIRGEMNFWINMSESTIWENIEKNYTHLSRLYRLIEENEDGKNDNEILNWIRIVEHQKAEKKIFDKFKTKTELLIHVVTLLKSVKEKLRLEYYFENDQELSQLLGNVYFEKEKMQYDRFLNEIENNKDIYENFGANFNLNTLIYFLAEGESIYHFHIYGQLENEKNNIISRFVELVQNEDIFNIGIKSNVLLGRTLITDIYKRVGKILEEGFLFERRKESLFKEFQIDNFYYLEAVRANTQRLYTWQSQGTAFNQLLLELVKSNEDWQLDFINHWLKEFGIGNELKININEHGIGAYITIDGKPLADLGYGVTQFLPILIKIVTIIKLTYHGPHMRSDIGWAFYDEKILYIEEPETNLHPKLQSKLADMLVDACNRFNLQIIVETHSEYLIRKLQYLTAKKEITPEMTVIHYFYDPKEARPEGEPQVKQINIQTDGRLTGQFGAGFYDETARLMTAILTGETLN